jgi:hypothetical protein
MMTGVFRSVSRDWDDFASRHRSWLERIPSDPLYSLPESAIARLERPRLKHPPLLDVDGATAERDLLALCRRSNAIGFAAGQPILYSYLNLSPPRSFREDFPDHEWTEEQWASVRSLEEELDRVDLRLKGYAGWLATEQPFLDAVGALESRWRRLPHGQRPDFPLRRTAPILSRSRKAKPVPAPQVVAAFAADYDAFCDRWGLIGMASWDLPEPQGPLIPSLLSEGALALPTHGLHIVLPVHYPLGLNAEFLGKILKFQRDLAADRGISRTAAGLPHHEAYATILEVVHWERVITGRFGRGARRPGFVGLVVEAVAEAIQREVNLVEKWRKAVSACRRGRRSSVIALRVKVD